LDLLDFDEAERVAALAVDLGLVMGSSEVHATPSAAPPQPRPGKLPGRARPRRAPSRSKSPQQRSDHARKPVISEQDSCSLAWIIALMSGLSCERYAKEFSIVSDSVLLQCRMDQLFASRRFHYSPASSHTERNKNPGR
jgi:hypothetical protein